MNKLNIKDFKDNFNPKDNKLEVIRERVFSKTQVDVVYLTLLIGSGMDLLILNTMWVKADIKKLSYVDYVWLSIIKELRSFGFTYKQIRRCQKELLGIY